jgi:hypothetical protein
MSTAVVTVVANNYRSHAKVLARSLATHHPEVVLQVVNAEEPGALEDIGVPNVRQFLFRYERQQVMTAIKPHAIGHLLDRGFDRVVFLDADTFVVGDLAPLLLPSGNPDIWLTPHLLEPPAGPDRIDRELRVLQCGTFNAGCVGVSGSNEGRRFLDWWKNRLHRHSRRALADGMFHDQRWLDCVPAFFSRVAVVRDPGCNVAYWNARERHAQLLRLVHFSGFDPRSPHVLSRYSPDAVPEALAPVFSRYARELLEAGYEQTHALAWPFDALESGVPIPAFVRDVVRDVDLDPFADPYEWLQAGVDDRSPRVTNLWDAVYRQRADVQRAFPDVRNTDREGFIQWTRDSGLREHAIPEVFGL